VHGQARIAFDEVGPSRATRQRFDAERTGTGEQVKTTRAVDHRHQPVEQRFAHAIRRRPYVRRIGHREFRSAQAAADDAQFSRGRPNGGS
jgi:hypothetical protein